MIAKSATARVGQRLLAAFRAAGAEEIAPDVLLPADTLLDLYGEDIRARAYVTDDPLRGEVMLRPDFTVPVVRLHMQGGAEPARYCYLGEVFRKQDHGDWRPEGERPAEYLQVGFEVFDRDRDAADIEVFALFHRLLAPLGLEPVIGDMALLREAVAALPVSPARRAALDHALGLPARFARLVNRFGAAGTPPQPAVADVPWIGARRPEEMAVRLARLKADAAEPPLAPSTAEGLRALLALDCPAGEAPARLAALGLPGTGAAQTRLAARLARLAAAGIDLGGLRFQSSHGRGTMDYYDGFTFSFRAPGRPDSDWPPVASGGRYDRLTARLGQGAAIPAVGGIVRPGLVAELEGASC